MADIGGLLHSAGAFLDPRNDPLMGAAIRGAGPAAGRVGNYFGVSPTPGMRSQNSPITDALMKVLGYSGLDAGRAYVRSAKRGADFSDTYDRFAQQGIAGGLAPGYHPSFTDAGRLAGIATNSRYPTDPHVQAQFVALLKQLGYLPHQAY